MRMRRQVMAAAGCVAVLLPLSGSGGGPLPAAGRSGPPPVAAPAPSRPAVADGRGRTAPDGAVRHVGALFHAGSDHFCSGAVVTGAGADLVVTAAHCVAAAGAAPYDDLEFAPAYGHGTAPYGLWKVARITVDPRWTAGADPDLDVAFVELARRDGRRLSDLAGADSIGFGPAAGGTVRLTGYPDGAADAITCLGTPTRPSAGQLRVECTRYTAGTSGSPWLAGTKQGTATVVGVIGGYQQGGGTADVSYSSYFGADVRQLYLQAAASH